VGGETVVDHLIQRQRSTPTVIVGHRLVRLGQVFPPDARVEIHPREIAAPGDILFMLGGKKGMPAGLHLGIAYNGFLDGVLQRDECCAPAAAEKRLSSDKYRTIFLLSIPSASGTRPISFIRRALRHSPSKIYTSLHI